MTNGDEVATAPMVLLPLAEAAPRLGLHPAARRSRICRGAVKARKGNDGRLLVEIPADARAVHDAASASPDDELAAELDYLRGELMHTLERAARAEERAAAVRELADRLTAELAEARRPWWRRWVGSP